MNSQEQYITRLPSELRDVVNMYIDGEETNEYFRNPTQFISNNKKKYIRNLTSVFFNIPPIDNPLVVYRGVTSESYVNDSSSYLSTSLNRDCVTGFLSSVNRIIMKITITPGVRVLPLYILSSYNEKEILIDRDQKWDISSVTMEDINWKDAYKEKTKVYHITISPTTSISLKLNDIPIDRIDDYINNLVFCVKSCDELLSENEAQCLYDGFNLRNDISIFNPPPILSDIMLEKIADTYK